ncbi:PrgH/EprH family type III secretion apparatus protein [Winslowiella iniecta]|nr:PrgH/EprH family type III secretion apparatus protein [Winslowiella iniecta]
MMEMDSDDVKRHYVIRFMNTLLVGCEYVIREERTTYIVADRHTLESVQQNTDDPATIYVLDDRINTRFDILFSAAMSLPQLVTGNESQAVTRSVNFHQLINVDEVHFVLRPEYSEWQQPLEEVSRSEEASDNDIFAPAKVPHKPWKKMLLLLLLAVMGLSGCYLLYDRNECEINSVTLALGGKPQEFNSFVGGDGRIYIFARTAQSSNRAWQSLIKNPDSRDVTVLNAKAEEEKISREIMARWPQVRFHGIRFDDPAKPEIILSQERAEMIPVAQLNNISAKLSMLFSWVKVFTFSYISDNSIINTAEQGILSITPYFNKRQNADSVTFSVVGKINDSELNAIKDIVTDFRKQWSGGYIQFDIKLEEDRLKGKSWRYGADGYVKTAAEQWFFPEQS